MKQAKKVYVADYGIMVNPNFAGQDGVRQSQMNRELAINEIRATVFDATVYEFDTKRRSMHLIAKGESPVVFPADQRRRINSEAEPGVMIRLEPVIKHL